MPATAAKTANNSDGPNGWAEYRRLVLAELERLSAAVSKMEGHGSSLQLALSQTISETRQHLLEKIHESAVQVSAVHAKEVSNLVTEIDSLNDTIQKQQKDITGLKTKAAMIGAVAGFLMAAGSLIAGIIFKK